MVHRLRKRKNVDKKEDKYKKEIPKATKYEREKVPVVIQMEGVECGAAALCSILGYFGKFVPLAELREACGVTRDGASVFGIMKAAQSYGLLAEAHMVELEDLYDLTPPFIVFWRLEHFVIIEGFSPDEVYLMDPGVGHVTITYEDLNAMYSGLVILFDTTLEFQKSAPPLPVFEALQKIFRKEAKAVAFALLAGLGLVIPKIMMPALTQIFVDDFLINNIYSWNEWFIFICFLLIYLTLTFNFFELSAISRLYIKLSTSASSEFLWHVLRLPYSFYLMRYSGEIANRLPIIEGLYHTLASSLSGILIDAFLAIFFGLALFYYDPLIAAIGIAITLGDAFILRYLFSTRLDKSNYYQQTMSRSRAYSIGTLASFETIKTTGAEFSLFGRWAGYYTKALTALQSIGRLDVYMAHLPGFLQMLTRITVLSLGGYKVLQGTLTVGMLLALFLLMELFIQPITRLVNFNQTIQLLLVSYARIEDVMANPIDPALEEIHKESVKKLPYPKLTGTVEVSHVTFGYDPNSEPLLKDIQLSVNPGTTVGIVGGLGSGKSTLAKLILGLLEPWKGEILFDNKPRKEWPRHLLTNSIAGIEQDTYLFAGTIKENITFFDPTIEEQVVIEAAKDADIHDAILSHMGGYDTVLHNNGKNLSSGEKLRIDIARALALQPSILVLDEATSYLDPAMEDTVMANIRKRGCTCLLIAQRISSLRYCDRIIVLDKGRIVEEGTQEELLQKETLFKKLYEYEQFA